MVFSGTAAAYGRGKAIVTATGMSTEIGRIAGLLEDTPEQATRCNGSWIARVGFSASW